MNRESLYKIAIIIAIIGLLDSIYLTYIHYTDTQAACPDVGVINCANVLNSQYSVLFGVPVAFLGIVFFCLELIALIPLRKNMDYFLSFSGVGLAFVFYYLYAEYMIKNICIYCTLTHICVVLLLIIAILLDKK